MRDCPTATFRKIQSSSNTCRTHGPARHAHPPIPRPDNVRTPARLDHAWPAHVAYPPCPPGRLVAKSCGPRRKISDANRKLICLAKANVNIATLRNSYLGHGGRRPNLLRGWGSKLPSDIARSAKGGSLLPLGKDFGKDLTPNSKDYQKSTGIDSFHGP